AMELPFCGSDKGHPIGHCVSKGGAPITLGRLAAGVHDFLVRCEKCPADESRRFEIEYAETQSDPSLLDAAKVDIKPLEEQMSVYSVRSGELQGPLMMPHPVDARFDIPAAARTLTVLVHGYNTDQATARS